MRKANYNYFGVSTALAVMVALLFGLLLVITARPAHAADLTVNSTNDSGTGGCDATECTLREAITAANNNGAEADTIKFNIPEKGPHTISPTSDLPQITNPLTIDGYSQPGSKPNTKPVGNNAKLVIELSGANAGTFGKGLEITAASSTVRGLVLNRWDQPIIINGSGAQFNKVEGNFIGTNVTGTSTTDASGNDLRNNNNGVLIYAHKNTVGGATPDKRNVISGSKQAWGVRIDGSQGGTTANENQVMGNYIGTDKTGKKDLGNAFDGVLVFDASNNIVGGTTAGERNLISGNDRHGVLIQGFIAASTNQVKGNYIGTDASGKKDLGNSFSGVFIYGSAPNTNDGGVPNTKNTVGGTTAGERNIISGNDNYGVAIAFAGATENQVKGNYIGTDAKGKKDLGNSFSGVIVFGPASNNTVGGTTIGAGNIISGNDLRGVALSHRDTVGNKVQGNYIGTDVTGTKDLGNSDDGVSISEARNNTIGGTELGASNIIFGNGGIGVHLINGNLFFATGNRILSNSIDKNTGLGIDFDPTPGVTDNAFGDKLQNYPLFSSVTRSGVQTTIQGTVRAETAETTPLTIQFFSSPAADPSGHGEGKTFLGQIEKTTDSTGFASFSFTTSSEIPPKAVVTATATNQTTGDTSEFSEAETVSQA